jgi:hypothetical protein
VSFDTTLDTGPGGPEASAHANARTWGVHALGSDLALRSGQENPMIKMLRPLAAVALVASSLLLGAPARAADPELKVTRVAVSTDGDSLQIFLSSPVRKGSCLNDYKVAARLDSRASDALLQLAIAAQLSGKTVEVTYLNAATDCVANSPQLTYLKMVD